MLITRKSPVSESVNTMEIDVTQEQLDRWKFGHLLIQEAMPNLTGYEREFIMTGITKEEWDGVFSDD